MPVPDVVCARCWRKIGLDDGHLEELVAAHNCPALIAEAEAARAPLRKALSQALSRRIAVRARAHVT